MSSKQPKSVFDMILSWSANRPVWQQDALRRIVATGALNDSDHRELVLLCKKGCGALGIALEPKPLTAGHLPGTTIAEESIALTSVTNVKGANRLAGTQTLPFGSDGITIVYGDNGVGKSGYSRILKRACRARFQGELLPNAFDPLAPKGASATISYNTAGTAAAPINWTDDGAPHPVLSAVSVYDRESGQVHIRDKNEVAFRPFGLDIPDHLAAACIAVKEALTTEQATLGQARDVAFSSPNFSNDTTVGRILRALTATTNLAPLEPLATLTPIEELRLTRLDSDLSRDPIAASEEQRTAAGSLSQLANKVSEAMSVCGDRPLADLLALADDAREKREAATIAAERTFSETPLKGVGEVVWRALWDAARRYSTETAYPTFGFPHVGEGAACVLCQQPLDIETRNRLTAFEAFVIADTEKQAVEAETTFQRAYGDLFAKPIRIPASLRQQLKLNKPDLARSVLRCMATARLRRSIVLRAANIGGDVNLPELPSSPEAALRQLATDTLIYAQELAKAADIDGHKRLEIERDELRDRAALVDLLPKAKVEVNRLASLALLEKCLGETTTNAVTALGNSIADEIITPRVRDRFQEEVQKLAASRVRVDIVRSGGKFGSPQYQVRLFANDRAKVGQILSEGEQTCVALAAFMTELATSHHRSALVFDDPVSSLDHKWRQKVAERLIEEASVRQIIVFTHDLVFFNDLQSLAQEKSIEVSALSLIQSAEGTGIVAELPWIAAKVLARIDNLEKEARAAKSLYEAYDESNYALAVARIYSQLRSTWERALEDVAFCGVITRHRDYVNAKELMKVTVLADSDVTAFQTGYKKCCDQTEAHDPSRARNAAPPPPDEVLSDIGMVRPWVEGIRARQKPLGK